MDEDTLCCADARLAGRVLSGREKGGAVWSIDLGDVSKAVYSEMRGVTQVRYALRLKAPGGWREVAVAMPRHSMAQSRDAIEHRMLTASVSEQLADLHPGFRIGYEVSWASRRMVQVGIMAALFLVVAAILAGLQLGRLAQGGAFLSLVLAVAGAIGVDMVVRRRMQRRWPDISAAALPGILTAMSRRE